MGDKPQEKLIGNLNDPKFKIPNGKESLQEKPVDFRAPEEQVIGNLNDPDFKFPEEQEPVDFTSIAKERGKGVNPLASINSQKEPIASKMAESLPVLPDGVTPAPVEMGKEQARERLKYIDYEIGSLADKRKKAQQEKNMLAGEKLLNYFDPDVRELKKYVGELDQSISELETEREDLLAKDEDISAIDTQIAKHKKEIEAINKRTAVTEYPYGFPTTTTEEKTPEEISKEQFLTNSINRLKQERARYVEAAREPDEAEKKEILANLGQISGNIKNADLFKNKGVYRVKDVEREFLNNAMEGIAVDNLKNLDKRGNYQQMMTFENIRYGKKAGLHGKVSPEEMGNLDSLFKDISASSEYQKADFNQKRGVVSKAVKDYLSKTIEDPEERKRKEKEYIPYFTGRMFLTPDGSNISLNGVQMYAEHLNGELVDRRMDLDEQYKALRAINDKGANFAADLDKKYGKENVDLYENQLRKEIKLLNDALDFNKKILDMNPEDPRLRLKVWEMQKDSQFEQGVQSMGKELLTAGISEMVTMLNLAEIGKNAEKGEIGWTESKILEAYTLLNMANGTKEMSSFYRIGKGISQMIPYVMSFVATGPAYTAGKGGANLAIKGFTKAINPTVRKSIVQATSYKLPKRFAAIYGKKVITAPDVAAKVLSSTTGAAVQTLANQQMLQANIARNQLPKTALTFSEEHNDMFMKIEAQTDAEKKIGKRNAYYDTFAEIYTERMGPYIMRGLKIPGAVAGNLPKKYLLSKYIDVKKINSPGKKIDRFIKKDMAWGGVAEEYMEEVANYFMASTMKGEELFQDGFWQQQLETLGTVAIFGAAMKGSNVSERWTEFRYGDNAVYQYKDSKGKKRKTVLPRQINDELKEILLSEEKGYAPITKLLSKHGNVLNQKQVELIISLKAQNDMDKEIDSLVPEDIKKNKPGEPVVQEDGTILAEEPTDTIVTEGAQTETAEIDITKDEEAEINKHNEQVVKNNPDLAEAGLLVTYPGGQMEVPTYEEMLDKVEEIHTQITSMAQKDEMGGLKIMDAQALTLLSQLDVLRQEIDARSETEGVPFKFQMPTSKHQKLSSELESGQKLEGKLHEGEDNKFRVRLSDGRTVTAFSTLESQKSISEGRKALKEGKKITLKFVSQDDMPARKNARTGEIYGDKISVMSGNTEIAIVENQDTRHIDHLKQKSKEIRQFLNEEFENFKKYAKTQDRFYGGIPMPGEKTTKSFIRMVQKLLEQGVVELRIIIAQLKDFIRTNNNLTPDKKQYWLDYIDGNVALIQQVRQEYFDEMKKKFDPENIEAPDFINPDAAFLSGEQKLEAHLKTYARIWREVAKMSNVPTAQVEKRFYLLSKSDTFNNVVDEDTYQMFLDSMTGTDVVTDNLLRYLATRPFSEIVSAFNFYSNSQLTKQYGLIMREDGTVQVKLLNPSRNFQSFVDSYNETVPGYKFEDPQSEGKVYYGIDAIWRELRYHKRIAQSKQRTMANATPEERTAIRKQQFQDDLELLSKITGIPASTWAQYFSPEQKNELQYATESGSTNLTSFRSYEQLLETDTFVGVYPRIQSRLMAELQNKAFYQTNLDEFKDQMDIFFTVGKKLPNGKRILANLFKLSTSLKDREELGSHGKDIKNDRFSSFLQYSHDVAEAERQGRELIILNGIHNLEENPDRKGTDAGKMSIYDIWFALIHMYAQNPDTYFQHMGQYGDKTSIRLIETDKLKPTTEDYAELRKKFPDFNDAAEFVYQEIMVRNANTFNDKLDDIEGANNIEKRKRLAMEFTYNYAVNMEQINETFHGNIDQYATPDADGLVGMMKRGGSTNSPGYRLNPNIKGGVGKSYRVLVLDDKILGVEKFDGLSLMSKGFSKKVAVSMGSIYNRLTRMGADMLDSVKALHSNVVDGQRGLMKTNNINIGALDMKYLGSVYKALEKLMADNNIDMITFKSGNKHTEIKGFQPTQIFDSLGNIKGFKITNDMVVERETADFYVQQDLRHTTEPRATKMPSQLMSNMYQLPNGIEISGLAYEMQMGAIEEFSQVMGKNGTDRTRMLWVRANVDEYSHPEIYRMLNAGIGFNEPSIRNMLRNILANSISRNIMEIPINRVTSQELPDADNVLEGRREIKDENGETRILLPDIATNIKGARAHYDRFEGKPAKALAYVRKNIHLYADLLDRDGNLMEWEITGRNGVIPGEPIISTRVPASDLHSHTVARLKYNLFTGNFTMLDQESQRNSGSDYDGDARFNQVFFKDKDGNAIVDDSKEGMSNQILMEIMYGYMEPSMTEKITTPIDPKAYSDLVKEARGKEKKFNPLDLRAYMRGWNDNKVGVDMKGILTDINTIFSIASLYQLGVRGGFDKEGAIRPLTLPWNENVSLDKFINDAKGQMKRHIDNQQNMAFDNAKNPQIEPIGLNEVTVNMWLISIMANPALEYKNGMTADDHYDAIYKAIAAQTKYFTSPMMKEFVRLTRRQNGGIAKKDMQIVWKAMTEKFGETEVRPLKRFFSLASDLPDIRRLYKLTQQVPRSVADMQKSQSMVKKFFANDYRLFDSGEFFHTTDKGAFFKMEFAIVPEMLQFMQTHIYFDAVEYSIVGKRIQDYIWSLLNEQFQDKYESNQISMGPLMQGQLESISYILNNIVAVRAVNKDKPFYEVRDEILASFKSLKVLNNKFLNMLFVDEDTKSLEVNPESRQVPIDEFEMNLIHKDYNKLSDEFKGQLERYVFMRYGTSGSRYNGSFYSLMSDKHKKQITEKIDQEIGAWNNGTLSPLEQFTIAKFVINASRDADIKTLWNKGQYPALNYDVTIAPTGTNIPLNYESLENAAGVTDNTAQTEWNKEYANEEVRIFINDRLGHEKPGEGKEALFFQDFVPWAKKIVDAKNNAVEFFENLDEQISDDELKNMLAEDSLGEALATDDPAVQEFILNQLKELYPDVVFFQDKEAFFEFVRKNGARLNNVSLTSIGHALGNAVYVDPTKGVQSSVLHEYAHVYWDALPADHTVKKQLLKLFGEEFPGLDADTLEEKIILAIGRSAFTVAESQLKGLSFRDKFTALMQKFWEAVKNLLGQSTKEELIDNMSKRLWNNRDKINPRSINGQAVLKNMAISELNADYDADRKMYVVGDEYYHQTSSVYEALQRNKFDAAKQAARRADHIAEQYFNEHGRAMQYADYIKMIHEDLHIWEMNRGYGEVVRDLAAQAFKGKPVAKSVIKTYFANKEAYQGLMRSFTKLRKDILEKYPNAKIDAKHITYSEANKIAGTIGLRIYLGDNKYVIINFKTTAKPFKDREGKNTEAFIKGWGRLKQPFKETQFDSKQMETFVRTGLYAMMEEEQGREIVEAYLVPVMRFTDDNGQVSVSYVANANENPWDNFIKINWKSKKDLLQAILKNYHDSRKSNQSPNSANKEELIKNGTDIRVAANMVAAESYLSGQYDLRQIKYTDIEEIGGIGLTSLLQTLSSKGFFPSDLNGPTAISAENLFFIASEGITRDEWEASKSDKQDQNSSSFIKRVDVGTGMEDVKNEYWNEEITKYHVEAGPHDIYMEEAGFGTLEKNDQIVEIAETEMPSGKVQRRAFFYTVIDVNTRTKRITVKDQGNNTIKSIISPEAKAGTLRVIPEDAEIPQNSFNPKYKKKKKEVWEDHWRETPREKYKSDNEYEFYKDNLRRLRRFFNNNPNMDKVRMALDDNLALEEFYKDIRHTDDEQIIPFQRLIREALYAHYISEQIQYEMRNMGSNEVKPTILNIYHLMKTNDRNTESMFNFSGSTLVSKFTTSRMINGKYVPLHFITMGVREAYDETTRLQLKLRHDIKPYFANVELSRILDMSGQVEYYKLPTSRNLSEDERKLLYIIYDHHYKYNPRYRAAGAKGTYTTPIQVNKMFATQDEMNEWFGKKHGRLMYDLMKPAEYDDVEIKEMNIETGRYVATGRTVTLRQIKEEFALKAGDNEYNRQWLGSKWRHSLSIFNTTKEGLKPGLLKYYDRVARTIYDQRETSDPKILRKKYSIPMSGSSKAKYQSNYQMEAEAKVIEGLIFNHYMAPLLAPLDEMMIRTKGHTDVTKWIKDYTDFIMFKQRPDGVNRNIRKGVDMIIRLNSLNKIAWQFRVQGKNLAIGMGMNLTREPAAFMKGMGILGKALFTPLSEDNDLIKVWNFVKKEGFIAQIAEEAMFDKLDKMLGAGLSTGKKLEGPAATIKSVGQYLIDKGYKPMEIFERFIQIPLMMGLMTKAELDSYDINGDLKNGHLGITRTRRLVIENRLKDVHGDYTPINANPFWFTTWGALMMQFRKWAPAMLNREFATYHLDETYQIKSGVMSTVTLLAKAVVWNNKSDQAKADRLVSIMKEYNDKTGYEKAFFTGASEYLNLLIIDRNGGKIKYKELSASDKRNAVSFAIQASTLILGVIYTMVASMGDDDDMLKPKKNALVKFLLELIGRYNSDVYFFLSMNQWEYMFENIIPAMDLVVNAGKLSTEFASWMYGFKDPIDLSPDKIEFHSNNATFAQDSPYAKAGWPKWPVTATKVVPMGSQVRTTAKWIFEASERWNAEPLIELLDRNGFKSKQIEEVMNKMDQQSMSDYEVKQWLEVDKNYKKAEREYSKYKGMEKFLDKKGAPSDELTIMNVINAVDFERAEMKADKNKIDALLRKAFVFDYQNGIMNKKERDHVEAVLEFANKQEKKERKNMRKGEQKRETEKTKEALPEVFD